MNTGHEIRESGLLVLFTVQKKYPQFSYILYGNDDGYDFSHSVMSELHVTGTVSVCSRLRCLWPNLVPVGSPASAVANWP